MRPGVPQAPVARHANVVVDSPIVMAVTEDFLAFVVEQLSRVTPVTSRRMFGGAGLYAGEVFFGVIDNNQLFLRTGPGNLADYEAQDCAPFQPMGPGTKPMSYHELPGGVLEDIRALRLWTAKSITEARAAKKPAKKTSPQRGKT